MKLSTNAKASELSWIQILQEQVSSLRFGVIQIVVHDSRVVQIDRTEKLRFEKVDHSPTTGH